MNEVLTLPVGSNIFTHPPTGTLFGFGGSALRVPPGAATAATINYLKSIFLQTDSSIVDESTTGSNRPVQPGWCYNGDGVAYLAFPHLTGAETVISSGGTATPTVSAGRIDFTGTLWDLYLSDGSIIKCDESAGTTTYNSDGSGNQGTIVNATLSSFHSTGATRSWQNDFGYSDGTAGVLVPRNEAVPTEDVLGNPLQYTGRVPYNGKFVESQLATFDGATWSAVGDIAAFKLAEFHIRLRVNFTTVLNLVVFEVDANNGFSVQVESAKIKINIGGIFNALALASIADGTDHLVEISNTVASGREMKVDGIVVASSAYIAPIYTNGTTYIGSRAGIGIYSGKLYDLELQDGSGTPVGAWAMSENSGQTLYDHAGTNHAPLTGINEATFWSGTQDAYHRNLYYGYDLWTRDSDGAVLRVSYTDAGVPVKTIGDTIAGYTWQSTHPTGNFHNGAETKIQPNPYDAPALNAKGITTATRWAYSADITPATKSTDANGNEYNYTLGG